MSPGVNDDCSFTELAVQIPGPSLFVWPVLLRMQSGICHMQKVARKSCPQIRVSAPQLLPPLCGLQHAFTLFNSFTGQGRLQSSDVTPAQGLVMVNKQKKRGAELEVGLGPLICLLPFDAAVSVA